MANQPIEIDINVTGGKDAERTIDDIKASIQELNSVLRAMSSDAGYKGTGLESVIKEQIKGEQELLSLKLKQTQAIKDSSRVSEQQSALVNEAAANGTSAQALIQRALDVTSQKVRLTQTSAESLNLELQFSGKQQLIRQLAQEFANVEDQIGGTEAAASALEAELRRVGATEAEVATGLKAFSTARGLQQDALGGSRRFLTGGSVLLNRLSPSSGVALGAASDIVELYKDFPKVTTVLADLGVSVGSLVGLGAGIGALTLAVGHYNNVLEEGKKAAQEGVKWLEIYYNTIFSGDTSAAIKAQIQDLETQKQIQENLIRQTQSAIDEIVNNYNVSPLIDRTLATPFQEVANKIALNSTGLIETLGGYNKKLSETNAAIEAKNAALQSEQIAENDAAMAIKARTDAQLALMGLEGDAYAKLATENSRRASLEIKVAQEISKLLSSGSRADVEKQLSSIDEEAILINAQLNSGKMLLAADKQRYEQRLEELAYEKERLLATENAVDIGDKYRKAQDQAEADKKKRIEDAKTLFEEATQTERDRIEAQKQLATDQIALAKELTDAINRTNAEYDKKVADLTAKDNADALKELQSYNDSVAKAQSDAQDKNLKAQEDYQRKLANIESQYTQASTDAVQARDAVAFDAAKRKRDEEKQQAEADFKAGQKERDTDAAKQLADLKDTFIKQRTERISQYRQQLADLQTQRQLEIDGLRKKNADQLATLQTAYEQQLTQMRQALLLQLRTLDGYWGTAQKIFDDALAHLSGGKPSGAAPTTFAGKYIPTQFDTGGIVTRTGMAKVHAGEVVLNQRQQMKYMGGITFAPVINGLSRSQVRQELTRQMDAFLDEVERA